MAVAWEHGCTHTCSGTCMARAPLVPSPRARHRSPARSHLRARRGRPAGWRGEALTRGGEGRLPIGGGASTRRCARCVGALSGCASCSAGKRAPVPDEKRGSRSMTWQIPDADLTSDPSSRFSSRLRSATLSDTTGFGPWLLSTPCTPRRVEHSSPGNAHAADNPDATPSPDARQTKRGRYSQASCRS